MGTLLAACSAVFWGTGDFLGGLAAKKTRAIRVVIASQLVGFTAILIAAPLLGADELTVGDFGWGALAGILGGIGLVAYFRGLARAPMGVVSSLSAVIAALIPFTYGVASGERPQPLAVAGVVACLVAILAITRDPPQHEDHSSNGLVDALIAGGGFGLFFVVLSLTGDDSGIFPLIGARAGSLIFLTLVVVVTGARFSVREEMTPTIAWAGFLDVFANMFLLLAFRVSLVSLASVLASLYPAATLVLARIVLNERFTVLRLAGVAMAIVGIALIAVG